MWLIVEILRYFYIRLVNGRCQWLSVRMVWIITKIMLLVLVVGSYS